MTLPRWHTLAAIIIGLTVAMGWPEDWPASFPLRLLLMMITGGLLSAALGLIRKP